MIGSLCCCCCHNFVIVAHIRWSTSVPEDHFSCEYPMDFILSCTLVSNKDLQSKTYYTGASYALWNSINLDTGVFCRTDQEAQAHNDIVGQSINSLKSSSVNMWKNYIDDFLNDIGLSGIISNVESHGVGYSEYISGYDVRIFYNATI